MDSDQPVNPPPPTERRGLLTGNQKRFIVLAICVGVMAALLHTMLGMSRSGAPAPNANLAAPESPEAMVAPLPHRVFSRPPPDASCQA